ncbi:MAG: DUF1269 domain-containing protein [Syntrophobacteraceae bacterium]
MRNLVISIFQDKFQAEQARRHLLTKEREGALSIESAVTMEKTPDGKVEFHHLGSFALGGAISGAFLGVLIGIILLNPVFAFAGLVVGSIVGLVAGTTSFIGIDAEFVESQAGALNPGNTALCVQNEEGAAYAILKEIDNFKDSILQTRVCTQKGDVRQCSLWSQNPAGLTA